MSTKNLPPPGKNLINKRRKPFEYVFTKGERRGLDFSEVEKYNVRMVWCFTLIPLHKYNKLSKGVERGKTPYHKGWQEIDYALFVPEWCMRDGHNIGVRIEDGLLIIDVDPRNYKNGIDSLKKLQKTFSFQLEDYPFVETGGGGYHIYMLLPEGLRLRQSHRAYQGIEFKTKGQVVAAGSVHPNGITYEWGLFSPTLEKIKRAPGKLLELLQEVKHESSELTGRHTPEQLAKMLEGLGPADFRDHQKWLALMMACHHATAGDGGEEFVGWSIGDSYYAHHAEKIHYRWDSLHSNGTCKITYKTLYKLLHLKGRDDLIPPPTTAQEDFEAADPEDLKPYTE